MDTSAPPPRRISVVVPVFNSAPTLAPLVERVGRALAPLCADHEIILVNDGSRDGSWAAIRALCAGRNRVHGLDLLRNFGQHNALLAGVRAARYEIVVTLDDDLQHPPEELPVLLAKLDEGYDLVYGAPRQEQHGFMRDLASRVTKRVLQDAMGAETAGKVSAFRVFRASVAGAFERFHGPYVCLDVLLSWGAARVTAVTVRHDPRLVGASNYTWRTLARHALNMMTGFSIWPLRVASLVGFGFTLFGVAVLAWVVGRYVLEGTPVPGFPFLASTIAVFSGAQLFALGIMGEYLARIHFRSLDRPPYAVRESLRPPPEGG